MCYPEKYGYFLEVIVKILVLFRLGIGDIILFTPVLKALRDKYPDAQIDILVNHEEEFLFADFEFIDNVIPYYKEKNLAIIWQLRKQKYDLSIALDFTYRSGVVPFFAGVAKRAGIKAERGIFMTNPVARADNHEQVYEPMNYADVIYRSTGIDLQDDLTKLHFPGADEKAKNNVCELLGPIGDYIVIAPYSAGLYKNWYPERYLQLVGKIRRLGLDVVIVSGWEPTPFDWREAINLIGRTSLVETGHIIKNARLLVSGCCANIHIGAAMGTPIVGIYGASSPARWAPRRNTTIITAEPECGPCLSIRKDCEHRSCMVAISVEKVFGLVEDRLNNPTSPNRYFNVKKDQYTKFA